MKQSKRPQKEIINKISLINNEKKRKNDDDIIYDLSDCKATDRRVWKLLSWTPWTDEKSHITIPISNFIIKKEKKITQPFPLLSPS